jgi:hypothetical protein
VVRRLLDGRLVCQPFGTQKGYAFTVKFAEDQRFLWDGLLRGDLSFTATDSSFTTYLDEIAGRNVVDGRGPTCGTIAPGRAGRSRAGRRR